MLRNTLASHPIITQYVRYEDSKELSLLMIILSLIFINNEVIDEGKYHITMYCDDISFERETERERERMTVFF